MTDRARTVEVGPRDGLQNEPVVVSIPDRIAFVERLIDAGCSSIEVGSFVSPKWVPQMAQTAEVLGTVAGYEACRFPVLVPNEQGLELALQAGAKEIAIFAAASETFSQRNINCSVATSIDRFRPVAERAQAEGLRMRGYISCVLHPDASRTAIVQQG